MPSGSLKEQEIALLQALGRCLRDHNLVDSVVVTILCARRSQIHLAAGVAVGAGIGYFLDRWLGTGPWLLILFFFLGAAGGMMNVYRAATGEGLQMGYRRSSTNNRPDDRAGDE